ncbi:putative ATP-dependent RNA helicase DDX46 [Halotydeus destructor]|nr:putative ATP-dependent RNA helicase DDX46 [Halotydeus destructor]
MMELKDPLEDDDVTETVAKKPKLEEATDDQVNSLNDDQIAVAEKTANPVNDEDDIDPLDAYMQTIEAEVKQLKNVREEKVGDKTISVVIGVAKNKLKIKGELLEQNQDLMEYSSEDEATTAEDLAEMNSNLQQPSKMKKVTTVTMDELTYIPFQKSFYIETAELARMTQEEVEQYRESLGEGIKVKGKNVPKPIKMWAQAGMSKKIMDNLKRYGYEQPTPIQAQTIPAIMSGRDLIGIAKTGSGKTLAFLLPMFRHILDQPELEQGEGPIAIIMTPTRELATQIWSECKKFAKSLKLRSVAVYGGTSISEQIGELKPGAEIVVCTPGRMIDMLAANSGRVTNLKRCTYIVLDEADRMFDMGFEPQVMRIIDGIRPDRQTVMFSATFPRIMEALARRILDKPVEVLVGGRSTVCKEVEQNVLIVEDDDKFLKLLELLGKHLDTGRSAIVFVDKQESADRLLKELMLASYTALALHGGIDQTDRDSIISDFKAGQVKVLVATSVAARGLDVKHCCLVVNYDCPNHYEDYVHRCGRTGRAGNTGFAYTFLTPDQGKYSADIIKAFELSGKEIPPEITQMFNTFKVAQEMMGKKVKGGSGFSGKGFKFDESEANYKDQQKKLQKVAHGLQDSDDDEEADLEADILTMLAPKKTVKQISQAAGQGPMDSLTPGGSGKPLLNIDEKIEQAKRLAAKISGNLSNSQSASSATEAILRGQGMNANYSSALAAKSLAEQRAERIHAKLNYIPSQEEDGSRPQRPADGDNNQGEEFQRYEEELEINDFPQQARWRVTSREALAQISEYSEAGLTVRGTYYPPGTKQPEGERKLYLAIEGTNELAVSKAKAEIIRLIKDELTKLQSSGHQLKAAGRYKVL